MMSCVTINIVVHFGHSVLLPLVLAGVAVCSKSIKAARANPIDSLRSE